MLLSNFNIFYLNFALNKYLVIMLDSVLLFGMPGGSEWIFIVVIVLVLFGGKKIPELMRGMGKGVKEFKDGIKGDAEEAAKSDEESNSKIDK